MITKKPYGVSPTVDVLLGNMSFNMNSLNSIEILLEESKHDTLVMDVTGIPTRAITEYYDSPIRVEVSLGAYFKHTFLGYIADVRPSHWSGAGLVDESPFQKAKIVCMGASYEMRGSRSAQWSGYSMSDVAAELAYRYSFSLDVPSRMPVHTRLVQTNESDWQFLTRYANLLGYHVNVHGTHMHVYDPDDAWSRLTSFHKLTTMGKAGGMAKDFPGQILRFDGSFSSRNPDGFYSDTVVSVLQDDGAVFDVSSTDAGIDGTNGARFPNRRSDYADTFDEAVLRVKANSKQVYDYTAKILALGVAGCVPGGIVEVDNYGGDFDGVWYVRSVKHVIHSDGFTSELSVGQNSYNALRKENKDVFQTPPKGVYVDGKWKTSEKTVNAYS